MQYIIIILNKFRILKNKMFLFYFLFIIEIKYIRPPCTYPMQLPYGTTVERGLVGTETPRTPPPPQLIFKSSSS